MHGWAVVVWLLAISGAGACPDECECSPDGRRATCRDAAEFPYLLSPLTQHLDVSGTAISSLSMPIANIAPDLRTLRLRGARVSRVDEGVFHGLRVLEQLDLSHNNISYLNPTTFRDLESLQWLSLSGNPLRNVSLSGPLSHLRHLYVEHCSLSDLKWLPSLPGLETLSLRENVLLSLSAPLLRFPSLTRLDLADNMLTTIAGNPFANLRRLQYLDLSGNMMDEFKEDTWSSLSQLTHLNLSRNSLSLFSPDSGFPSSLEILDLSYNDFSSLETASFDNLPNLRVLNFSSCRQLSEIKTSSFLSLSSLEWISFSGCALVSIENGAFNPLPSNLSFFSLADNRLRSLAPSLGPAASSLVVDGNPLDCSCSLRSLSLSSGSCFEETSHEAIPLASLSPCSGLSPFTALVLLVVLTVLFSLVVLIVCVFRSTNEKGTRSPPLLSHSPHRTDTTYSSEYEPPTSRTDLYPSYYAEIPYCHSGYRPYAPSPRLYMPPGHSPPLPPPNPLPPPPPLVPDSSPPHSPPARYAPPSFSPPKPPYQVITSYPVPITRL